jgi:hypothetical protein
MNYCAPKSWVSILKWPDLGMIGGYPRARKPSNGDESKLKT